MKDNLAKQFEDTEPCCNYEHMRVITSKILKTQWLKWLKIHESGLGLYTFDGLMFGD